MIRAIPIDQSTMPQSQMLTSLKNVSESMIGLLTLLLQVLVHQLENQPLTEDNDEPPNAEVTQTMNTMLQELQNQRQVLQGLVANQMRPVERQIVQSTAASSQPAPAPSRTRSTPTPVQQPVLNNTLVNRPLQDLHLPASAIPGSPAQSTWILAEEEEEYEEMLIPEVARTRFRSGNTRTTTQPLTSQVSVAEWGMSQITWGKKHKGKSYQEVFRNDIGYYHWSLARFQSLPANQQDFVRYCQVQLSGPASLCSSSFRDVIDSSFHQEVQLTREQLSSQNQPSISNDELSHSYDAAEGLIEQVFHTAKLSRPRSQIKLLEVYAGSHSPLVEAVRSLGFKAMRFSKEDGDLSTVAGRKKLWELIDCFQPEHIWVAPECRPWGGWSRLNQFKSVKLFDQITKDQHEQLQHVKLCASIGKYQQARCRHFHLAQPLGSHMPELPEFQSIREIDPSCSCRHVCFWFEDTRNPTIS